MDSTKLLTWIQYVAREVHATIHQGGVHHADGCVLFDQPDCACWCHASFAECGEETCIAARDIMSDIAVVIARADL